MPVSVRDLARKVRHDLSGDEPMLRVPYDLLTPEGPVRYANRMITYLQGGKERLGRAAPAPLADARPGERVLIRLSPRDAGDDWWLCEVVEVGP